MHVHGWTILTSQVRSLSGGKGCREELNSFFSTRKVKWILVICLCTVTIQPSQILQFFQMERNLWMSVLIKIKSVSYSCWYHWRERNYYSSKLNISLRIVSQPAQSYRTAFKILPGCVKEMHSSYQTANRSYLTLLTYQQFHKDEATCVNYKKWNHQI